MALFGNKKTGLAAFFDSFKTLDEGFYEELEETMILADMGVEPTVQAVEELRRRIKDERIKQPEEARACLRRILAEMLSVGEPGLKLDSKPSVCLFVGVNGVGKTTSIGKLGARFHAEGKRVIFCAGDTFRAAAAEQLTIWSERAEADIIKQGEGADPAAVVFDGAQAAKARGADIMLVDTAGRLHNKQNLMNELSKISRVLDRELPDCDRETLLVIDATTGQNGLTQAKVFKETTDITGIILTKLDGTAKGGIVVAIAQSLGVPVKFIGVGEQVDQLKPFDAQAYAEALI